MRILLLVDCYLPSTKSSAKLVHDLAIVLSGHGHDVTVMAPAGLSIGSVDVRDEDGVRVVRVRSLAMKGIPRIFRAIREAMLSRTIWRRARSILCRAPIDLVVYYSPTIFFGDLVRRLKRRWNCHTYLILRDIFPQWALETGILQKGPIYSYFRRKELCQYAQADVIGIESHGNFEYFDRSIPGNAYRIEVLRNWTSVDEGTLPMGEHRRELGLEGKVIFVYGGNLGVAQDVDNLVRLAVALRDDPTAFFLLIGDGSEVRRLTAAIGQEGLDNIRVVPSVDQRLYLSMLAEFDVGILSLDRKLRSHNVPGKILGYMYSGLPVLASLNPGNQLAPLIQEWDAGFACENGEDALLADAARRLARDAVLRRRQGANARRLLEREFSADKAARQIVGHFQGVERGEVEQVSDGARYCTAK